MKTIVVAVISTILSFATVAKDRLEVYKDYEVGKEIISMTTVKIDPNMSDVYLAGLSQSWVKAVKIQKELGYIKDWKIYGSELSESGDFNMVLMVVFKSSADLEPNKERYKAFMKKWGEENQKRSQKISAKYPDVRTLTGEYRLREIIML